MIAIFREVTFIQVKAKQAPIKGDPNRLDKLT